MIPIRAKLKIQFNDPNSSIESISFSVDRINVSSSIGTLIVEKSSTYRGFQLSPDASTKMSLLDGSCRPFPDTGYAGVITSTSSSSTGIINMNISFTLSSNLPDFIYLIFDPSYGVYLTQGRISNGTTVRLFNNNSYKCKISLKELNATVNDTFTIGFMQLNKAYSNVYLLGLTLLDTEIMSSSQLISFNCSENIMDSNLEVNPGICEQYANIEVYDKNGILRDKALRGELHTDQYISIIAIDDNVWIDGTDPKGEISIGEFLTEEWQVENNNSRVKINCRDISYRLDKIKIPRISIETRTVDQLLNILFSNAPQFTWTYLDTETQFRCEHITIEDCWYAASDLKTLLESICSVGMLRIYYFNKTFFVGRCI